MTKPAQNKMITTPATTAILADILRSLDTVVLSLYPRRE
jgi:hypothetical protein